MSEIDPKLLSLLRIEGELREDEGDGRRRGLGLALSLLLVAGPGGAAWWLLTFTGEPDTGWWQRTLLRLIGPFVAEGQL